MTARIKKNLHIDFTSRQIQQILRPLHSRGNGVAKGRIGDLNIVFRGYGPVRPDGYGGHRIVKRRGRFIGLGQGESSLYMYFYDDLDVESVIVDITNGEYGKWIACSNRSRILSGERINIAGARYTARDFGKKSHTIEFFNPTIPSGQLIRGAAAKLTTNRPELLGLLSQSKFLIHFRMDHRFALMNPLVNWQCDGVLLTRATIKHYVNSPPVAKITASTTHVKLNNKLIIRGSESRDADGDRLTYRWKVVQQPNGSQLNYDDKKSSSINFEPKVRGEYQIELVVNDGQADSKPIRATYIVNSQPVIKSLQGGTSVVGANITMTPARVNVSDDDGDSLTYQWTLTAPDGSSSVLNSNSSTTPSFTPDIEGNYRLTLVVNDGYQDSAPQSTDWIITKRPNTAPIAAYKAIVGTQVQLDGSDSSDIDGDNLTYQWTVTHQSNDTPIAITTTQDGQQASFTPSEPGEYQVKLVVSDGEKISEKIDTIIIENRSPEAAIDSESYDIIVGERIEFDGLASTDDYTDTDKLTFKWSFAETPEGSNAQIETDSDIGEASFIGDKAGIYIVELIVNDGEKDSEPESLVFSVLPKPTVSIGKQQGEIAVGEPTLLSSDIVNKHDDDPLTYQWRVVNQPQDAVVVLQPADQPQALFAANVPGDYQIELLVFDGDTPLSAVTTVIRVNANNQVPIAQLNPTSGAARIGNPITVSGQSSYDGDNDALTYQWRLYTPLGSTSQLSYSEDNKVATFTPDMSGDYRVDLVVNDGKADSLVATSNWQVLAGSMIDDLVWDIGVDGGSTKEYITMTNKGMLPVDLSGYTLYIPTSSHYKGNLKRPKNIYTFAAGTILAPDEEVTVYGDNDQMPHNFGSRRRSIMNDDVENTVELYEHQDQAEQVKAWIDALSAIEWNDKLTQAQKVAAINELGEKPQHPTVASFTIAAVD